MRKLLPFLIACIMVLSSCSANYYLNRAIKKDPSILSQGMEVISKRKLVEIEIPKIEAQVKGNYLPLTPTIFVDEKTGVITKITVNEEAKTIEVKTTVPERTVSKETITEQTIVKPIVKPKKGFWATLEQIAIYLGTFVLGAIVGKTVLKG